MFLYRICLRLYTALDGEGARLFGGRWNSPGQPAVYTFTSLSLAALEYLVHVNFDNLPVNLVWVKIELPDSCTMERFPKPTAPNERDAAAFGDAWLRSRRTVALIVPSAVLSVEQNVIVNPLHPEMSRVKTLETNKFEFDDRLFRR